MEYKLDEQKGLALIFLLAFGSRDAIIIRISPAKALPVGGSLAPGRKGLSSLSKEDPS
jgi:hypothetical protein